MIASTDIHAAVGEFQRNYIYKIFIETIPPSVAANFPQAQSFAANVDLYNKKAIFPNRKTNNINIPWGGEFFDIPGTDGSTRDTTLEFFDDEPMWVYDFFSACKDLTGNEYNQAGVYGVQGKFNIGIAKVSVDKETITAYRRLFGVRVYGLDASELDKGGDTASGIQVEIRWDRNIEDKAKRGAKV